MRKISKVWIIGMSLLLVVAVAALGCETYGESAGLGALIGSGAGAIIGNQSGHAGQGALIGAVVGGAAGLIIKVPQFVKIGDPIRISVATREYLGKET